MATDLTGATVELLQTLIRNQCVNDGTRGVGSRDAQRRRPAVLRRGPRRDDRAVGADAGPGVVRRPARGARPERAEPVPDGPHRRRARARGGLVAATRSAASWSRNGDGVDEVWGRGAVDMLNLTASMAVAFRDLADARRPAARRPALLRRRRRGGRQRPRRPLGRRPPPGRDPLRLPAHRERRPARRHARRRR